MTFTIVDTRDLEAVKQAITPETKAIYLETPTNPLLRVTDIAAVADIAKQHKILSVIDNTFASPYIQRPIELGVDIVLHSASKYLRSEERRVGKELRIGWWRSTDSK